MKIRLIGMLLLMSLGLSAQVESAQKESKYLPLFGKKALKGKEQADLTAFIESCDASFATRKEAIEFFGERAWEYVAAGKLDTATYRFNLIYALDNQSVDAFWGLGVISFQRQSFPDAIQFLQTGLLLDSTQSILRVDLAIVKLSCYLKGQDCGTLDEADALLQTSLQQLPTNAMAWMKRAQVAYLQEKYENAWGYLHECRRLDITQMDISLGQSLAEKLPDPQGVFK